MRGRRKEGRKEEGNRKLLNSGKQIFNWISRVGGKKMVHCREAHWFVENQ